MRFWRLLVATAIVSATVRSTVGLDVLSEVAWSILQLGPVVFIAALGLVGPRQAERVQPFTLALAGFVAVATVSSVQSEDPGRSLYQAAVLAVVGGALSATVNRRWTTVDRLRADIHWLGWLLAVMHGAGLVAHHAGVTWADAEFYDRYQGLYFNANYAGLTAAVGLLAVLSTRLSRADGAAALLLGYALLASGSRGALMGAIVGVIILAALPATRARLAAYIWASATALTVAAMFRSDVLSFFTDFYDRVREASDPTSGRLGIYQLFWERWEESPILGTGYQTGRITVGSALDGRGYYEVYGHNVYLSTLVETGILGAIALAVLLATIAAQARRREPLASIFAAILVYELTESTLFGFGNPIALLEWLLIAAYAATGLRSGGDPADDGRGDAVGDRPRVAGSQRQGDRAGRR